MAQLRAKTETTITHQSAYLPWVMWSIPLLFFSYQFIFRLWPGLMMPQIMQQFSIDASHFGVIAAFYYYGYAGMQIPVAILMDRFGAKHVLFIFAVLCGAATLLFTYSTHWYLACLSRFLVGAGSAAGILGVSKVISEWFPKIQYTKMMGFSFTVGLMGAIYGGKPISLLIDHYPWKSVAVTLSMVSMLMGLIALCVLRPCQKKAEDHASHEVFTWSSFKVLLASPKLWLLAIANLLMVGSLEGFSDVWGVPYLMTAYSISKNNAAQLVSLVFLGMLSGGPLLAMGSKKLGNYNVIALCGFGMAMAFVVLFLTQQYHGWFLAAIFFSIGVMCSYQVNIFSAGADLVKPQYLGVTIAFLNCINMLGGSFFHTGIGILMDMFSKNVVQLAGIKQYSLGAYQASLALIPICAMLGALVICCLSLRNNRFPQLANA